MRETTDWQDEIYLGGFGESCHAVWRRRSSLVVPGGLPITERVAGNETEVLHAVVADWPT
ncbi:MAG: hypothetical protein M3Y48_11245 [Actinomycetota bacterium]|nr:hypothetical protein [Actinomycetota bacterium]